MTRVWRKLYQKLLLFRRKFVAKINSLSSYLRGVQTHFQVQILAKLKKAQNVKAVTKQIKKQNKQTKAQKLKCSSIQFKMKSIKNIKVSIKLNTSLTRHGSRQLFPDFFDLLRLHLIPATTKIETVVEHCLNCITALANC